MSKHHQQAAKKVSPDCPDWEKRRRYFYLLCGYHGLNESWREEAEWYVSSRVSEAGLRKVVETHIRNLNRNKNPDPDVGLEEFDGQREIRKAWVDDPNPSRRGYQERVNKNVRHDYLEKLYSRRKIGDAQKRAGDRVRQLFETLGVGLGSVKSVDLAKIRVDTSGPGADMRPSMIDASQTLTELSRFMDGDKYALVIRVCGLDERLAAIAPAFEEDESQKVNGNCSQRTNDYCARIFRSGLMQAAIFFGYATKRETKQYHAPMQVWASDESARGKGLST